MRILAFLFIVTQVFLLTGCLQKEQKSAEDFLQEVKQEKNVKITPLPETQKYTSVDYSISAMRSPFKTPDELPPCN